MFFSLGKSEELILNYALSFVFGTGEYDHTEEWSPLSKFSCPVLQCGLRNNDEVGTGGRKVVIKVSEEGNRLEGFSETLKNIVSLSSKKILIRRQPNGRVTKAVTHHFISQNSIQAIMMQRNHPI